MYSALKPLKVPDEIVRHIKSLIKKGKLHAGDKFPAERTLSTMLGVGRSTLREAMKTLSILGFVEIRERQGAFVRNLGASMIPDSFAQIMDEDHTRIKDLYEIRKDLEMGSSYMAAKTRRINDIKLMEKLLVRMDKQARKPRLGIEEDIGFHLAVARASGNILRVHVLESLFDRYGHYIDIARRPLLKEPKHNQTVCSHHWKIFHSIERKQPAQAREAMYEHLSWVEKKWENHEES